MILLTQFCQGPFDIFDNKSTVFPIGNHPIGGQAIEIDRDVNIHPAKSGRKFFEMLAPVLAQDRTVMLSILRRPIIGPRMDFKFARALRGTIGEDIVGPPAFEIAATPDCDMPQLRNLERTIDPATAGPSRRANVPIRMIIKRDQNKWFSKPAKPKRAQIMKVARAIKRERRETLREFAIKLFDHSSRRAETQSRAPISRVDGRH